MAIQTLKTALLPVGTDFGNAYTKSAHKTSNPSPREGVAALPYAEIFRTMAAQRLKIHKGAGGRGGPPLRGGFVNKGQIGDCPMAIQILKTAL